MSKRQFYTAVGRFALHLAGPPEVTARTADVNEVLFKTGRASVAKNRAYLKKKISGYGPATRTALARFRRSTRGGEFLRKSAFLLGALDMQAAMLKAGAAAQQAGAAMKRGQIIGRETTTGNAIIFMPPAHGRTED